MGKSLNRQTVDRLVVEHLPLLLRVARRLTGEASLAEDLVQETLRRVLARWRTYRGEAPFEAWMLRVLMNVNRDRQRRTRHAPLYASEEFVDELPSASPGPHEDLIEDELHDQIRCAVDALPERQREVALLVFGEGQTAAQVAQALGITTANVHASLHLARKRIANVVGYENSRRTE